MDCLKGQCGVKVDGSVDRSNVVVEPDKRRRSRPAVVVIGLASVVGILLVAVTIAISVRRYGAELGDAARNLRTLDLVLVEETGRSLQSVALILDNVADQVLIDDVKTAEAFAERQSTKAVNDALRVRLAGIPQLDAVTVISAQGKLLNFSRAWPVPAVDLSDRDYFRYLRDHQTTQPFVSEPVINRGSGTPTVYLARRISAPDGTFLGLALGAIELGYFDRLYASLQLETGSFIALWRQDGVLLARFPPARIGQRISPATITSPDSSWHGVEGVFEKRWTIDGGAAETRVVAARAVNGFPIQVNIGRSKTAILADWRREVIAIGSAVTFALVCVGLLAWALLRRFHAYEAIASAYRELEGAIVARRAAEEALRQAQKMEAVGQLTGGVAHDFNNLLTVVRSSVDLLSRPNLTEDRRLRYVSAISDATDRATKLTAQLLAFARRQALKPEVFDAVESVAAVGQLVARLTGARVQVKVLLPDHPCHVRADRNQFDTAIVNMAVNGRDAMQNGGELCIALTAVDSIPATRSDPDRRGAFAAVSVTDTGTGIPPELIDRVFEPFFTTKRVGEGTGLGLSQVFGFAKQSGGDVAVASNPGPGTTFTLYLPRTEERPTAMPAEPAAGPVVGDHQVRVLVVEDNEQVGRSTFHALTDLGYDVVLAESAEQALATIQAQPHRFDIVFSDVVMPGMSGLDLGLLIRERFAGLPVVLASGYSHVLAEEGHGGFCILQKPYALDELARTLCEALPQSHRARQTA